MVELSRSCVPAYAYPSTIRRTNYAFLPMPVVAHAYIENISHFPENKICLYILWCVLQKCGKNIKNPRKNIQKDSSKTFNRHLLFTSVYVTKARKTLIKKKHTHTHTKSSDLNLPLDKSFKMVAWCIRIDGRHA